MISFIKGRIKSFQYAFKGAYVLITTEHSIMLQASCGIGVTILGFYYGIRTQEWVMQTLTIGVVLCAEGLNSAVELICNFIHPNHHQKIGKIKDIAAGSVGFVALAAFIIFLLIYYPYFTACKMTT